MLHSGGRSALYLEEGPRAQEVTRDIHGGGGGGREHHSAY